LDGEFPSGRVSSSKRLGGIIIDGADACRNRPVDFCAGRGLLKVHVKSPGNLIWISRASLPEVAPTWRYALLVNKKTTLAVDRSAASREGGHHYR
jgi:hypothetical protein